MSEGERDRRETVCLDANKLASKAGISLPSNHTHTHTHTHSNGANVEGMDHQSVVQLIRKSGNQVKMLVVSVSDEEARRLEPETNTASVGMDYYERRSVPVTIPTSKKKTDDTGREYVVYDVYIAGREVILTLSHTLSLSTHTHTLHTHTHTHTHTPDLRYREFDALSTNVSSQIQHTHTHTLTHLTHYESAHSPI